MKLSCIAFLAVCLPLSATILSAPPTTTTGPAAEEVADLQNEIKALKAENAALRQQLKAAGVATVVVADSPKSTTRPAPPAATQPTAVPLAKLLGSIPREMVPLKIYEPGTQGFAGSYVLGDNGRIKLSLLNDWLKQNCIGKAIKATGTISAIEANDRAASIAVDVPALHLTNLTSEPMSLFVNLTGDHRIEFLKLHTGQAITISGITHSVSCSSFTDRRWLIFSIALTSTNYEN